jgi:hypothetical protein
MIIFIRITEGECFGSRMRRVGYCRLHLAIAKGAGVILYVDVLAHTRGNSTNPEIKGADYTLQILCQVVACLGLAPQVRLSRSTYM